MPISPRSRANMRATMPFQLRSQHAYRGESDEAIRWLDRAYAQKDPTLYLVKGRPAAQESRTRSPLQGVLAQDEAAGVAASRSTVSFHAECFSYDCLLST